MKQLLIVEDDPALGAGIALALRSETCATQHLATLALARQRLAMGGVSLVVLDLNLPDGSGLDLLREIKSSSALPVILLTANDLETDIVTGLELGADDYITKPFSLMVLRARVGTQLRKAAGVRQTVFLCEGLRLDFGSMEFFKDGQAVELSKTEQKLLRLLTDNAGITLARAQLIDRIWTDGAEYVDENALSVTVKRLRDKLEDNPAAPYYIKTVYGVGYTWATR